MASMGGINGAGATPAVLPNDGINIGFIKQKLEDPNTTPEQKKEYLSFVLGSMKEDPNPGPFKKSLIDQISKLVDGTIDDTGLDALAKALNTSKENLQV